MDLSRISTEDLRALKAGDLSKVSTEGLRMLRGGGSNVESIPGATAQGKPDTGATGAMANYLAPYDAALSMGTGVVGGIAGQLVGIGRTIAGGKLGTPEGVRQGAEDARKYAEALTYRPRTELGREIVSGIGKALDVSKLAGLGPTEAIAASALAGPAARQAGAQLRSIPVPSLSRAEGPEMVGVGAAESSVPAMRIERAQALPVPIKLTKGQAERTFEQQRFERETAKDSAVGGPLRERFADQTQDVPRNLEFFADETGGVASSLRATGNVVTDAILEKAKKVKGKVDAAYEEARTAGAMQDPINVAPVTEYLESKRSQFRLAGVLESTLDDLSERAKKTGGVITINDLEDVRKGVVAASQKDATNAHYAREINKLIDDLTENVGGSEYKYARRLYKQYKNEFENVGLIDRLMSYKPGTKDRAIAFEDVFDKAILGGSLDDVRAVRRTLQTAGPKGEQAWRELQAQTVKHIQELITGNAARDVRGNPVVSPAKFNNIIKNLDADGKLDFIFGKQGAQKLRDLKETSMDVFTSPPGTINTSGTGSVVLEALDNILRNIPGIKHVKTVYQNTKTARQAREALQPDVIPKIKRR